MMMNNGFVFNGTVDYSTLPIPQNDTERDYAGLADDVFVEIYEAIQDVYDERGAGSQDKYYVDRYNWIKRNNTVAGMHSQDCEVGSFQMFGPAVRVG